MRYQITTPSGATTEQEVKEEDHWYLEDIKKRGYVVQVVQELSVCTACEG